MKMYHCSQCEFTADCEQMEKIVDHIYGHAPIDNFGISRVKAIALYKFLMENGYISYEFHPLVHDIIKDLEKYLDEDDKK